MDKKKLAKFNLNHYVYVNLNITGVTRLLQHTNRFTESRVSIKPYTMAELSARYLDPGSGLWKMQMHEFMDVYGSTIQSETHFGLEVYFDPGDIVIQKPADNTRGTKSTDTGSASGKPTLVYTHDGRGSEGLGISERLRNKMNANVEEMHCWNCDAITGHTSDGEEYRCCNCGKT